MFHSQVIAETISQVATKEKTDEIFNFSKKKYDLHQFNIATLYPKDVKKMHQSLKRRYKQQEIEVLPRNWNQGERRLFIWFIICYLYLEMLEIEDLTQKDLMSLAQVFFGKDTIFLDFQLKNLPRVTKEKRSWTKEEDELLKATIKSLKADEDDEKVFNNWNDVAKIIFFHTERRIFRTPKACRQRWYNHLDESKKKDEFTLQEDLILINYILTAKKSWSKIVKVLGNSRTQHRVKNRYYTLIRKYQKNFGMGDQIREENEKMILIELKKMYENSLKKNEMPEEIADKSSGEHNVEVKVQQREHKMDNSMEVIEENKLQYSGKTENQKFIGQIACPEASEHQSFKTEQLEEQISQKSQNMSIDSKQNSKRTIQSQNEVILKTEENNIWTTNYVSAPYYYPMMQNYNLTYNETDFSMIQPIVVNQFYCPIIIHNGMDYQFIYQN